MKLVEFTYTKANGDVSNRAVVVQGEPTKFVSGIDVSDLPEAEFAQFVADFNALKDRQAQELQELMHRHDVRHNYRQFDPAKMTSVVADWV